MTTSQLSATTNGGVLPHGGSASYSKNKNNDDAPPPTTTTTTTTTVVSAKKNKSSNKPASSSSSGSIGTTSADAITAVVVTSKSTKKSILTDKKQKKENPSTNETSSSTTSTNTKPPSSSTSRSARAKRGRSTEPAVEAASTRSRPKRRAASSVRFGSYRDSDAVDFSLLEHFRYDGEHSFLQAKSSIGSSPSSSKKKSSLTAAVLKRKSLIASSSKQLVDAKNNVPPSGTTTTNTNRDGIVSGIPGISSAATQRPQMGSKISGAQLLNLLPPVLLTRTQDAGGDGFTPSSLRHLSSKNGGMVDIFNRKTGRIMKGENGVSVKDLATALRNHSEYEPIVPRSSDHSSGAQRESQEYRQARSSANGRVSEEVLPQTTIRESNVEGRTVLITGGTHKGLFGTIDACIPGNWYVVSNVFNDDTLDLDIVLHSDNLKLISASYGRNPNSSKQHEQEKEGGKEETKLDNANNPPPLIKTIESVLLRAEAYEEQREKLITKMSDQSETTQGKELELRRITKRIKDTRAELQTYRLAHEMIVGKRTNLK